jgi:hypothetical protein
VKITLVLLCVSFTHRSFSEGGRSVLCVKIEFFLPQRYTKPTSASAKVKKKPSKKYCNSISPPLGGLGGKNKEKVAGLGAKTKKRKVG